MSSFPTLLRFLGVGLVWGSSYMWISMALESFSWQMLTWIRPLMGLATLGILILIQRPINAEGRIFPRDPKVWLHLMAVGVFLTACPSIFYAMALGGISSNIVSIYSATVTLITAVIAGLFFKIEKLRSLNWLGILIGAAGVLLVVEPWNSAAYSSAASQIFVLIAVTSVGLAYAYQQKFLGHLTINPIVAAFMLTIGPVLIELALTPWVFILPTSVSANSWLALFVLGIGAGAIGYVWNGSVLEAWGATGASMVNYLNPIIGVILGSLVLGESFTISAAAGTVVIFAGIAVDRLAHGRGAKPANRK